MSLLVEGLEALTLIKVQGSNLFEGPSYLLANHIVKLSSAQLYRFDGAIEL